MSVPVIFEAIRTIIINIVFCIQGFYVNLGVLAKKCPLVFEEFFSLNKIQRVVQHKTLLPKIKFVSYLISKKPKTKNDDVII